MNDSIHALVRHISGANHRFHMATSGSADEAVIRQHVRECIGCLEDLMDALDDGIMREEWER